VLIVLSILGTRPEAIKLAPVIRELAAHPDQIVSRVCATAQHRQMLDQVLSLFHIAPDYDLNVMHRARSLLRICRALRYLAHSYDDMVHILYPVHLNLQVWEPVHRCLSAVPAITLVPPLDYLPFVQVLKRSYLVLTDSGGLQEEALILGKPVLVLRHTTERPVAVEAGTVKSVGPSYQNIVRETAHLLEDAQAYQRMAQAINPYGDGHAARHRWLC
jgi:UDP-N-acetylglucosamine 2-epimerase